ncbi:hypothetical protein SNEBB_008677 [Seison nebaliae]|nr:hypothetical protein SNEBB_008677 [Seison nebaliae]
MGTAVTRLFHFPLEDDGECYEMMKDDDEEHESQDIVELREEMKKKYYDCFEQYFEEYINRREFQSKLRERVLYIEKYVEEYRAAYPHFTSEALIDFRNHFLAHDDNEQCAITFEHFNAILNMLGDKTKKDQRLTVLLKVDADGSGSLDFDEYLDALTLLGITDALVVL